MESAKKEWIVFIRVIATFSVIILHVSAEIPTLYNKVSNTTWFIGNFFDSLVRCCVPLFLMISGALLLGKGIDKFDFLRKRFLRVLLPFLFWSSIYIFSNIFFKILHHEDFNLLEYISNSIHYGSANHMWFVYMILGIYLFIPILNKWIINSNKKEINFIYYYG